jgi:hypothetical protein
VARKDSPSKRLKLAIEQRRAGNRPYLPEVFEGIPGSVLRAFDVFGYDPRNPRDWKLLLHHFAEAHFGKVRRKPKNWHDGKLCQLGADFLKAKEANRGKPDTEICKLLVADKALRRYRKVKKANTMRRLLPKAHEQFAKAVAKARDDIGPLTAAEEKELTGWLIESYATCDNPTGIPSWDLPLDEFIAKLRGN